MNPENENEVTDFFSHLTVTLAALGQEMDEFGQQVFFDDLQEYPLEDVLRSLKAFRRDPDKGFYRLTVADVIRRIEGGSGSRALAAWDEALKAVREVGAYKTVTFGDPLIMAAIERMDGWVRFCQMTEEDKPFKQKEFTERYTLMLASPPSDPPKALPGIAETENRFSGWGTHPKAIEADQPVMIGQPKPRRKPIEPKVLSAPHRSSLPAVRDFGSIGAALDSVKPSLHEPTPEEIAETNRRREELKRQAGLSPKQAQDLTEAATP